MKRVAKNTASYSASSTSVGVGTGAQAKMLGIAGTGIGMGHDSGSSSSATRSGISGIAGDKSVRSTDAETGIATIFDKEKVQADVDAQAKIMETFTREAPKAAASFAQSQINNLKESLRSETDPEKQATIRAEIARWDEGGAYRVAMHAGLGALAGGVAGALGAGAAAEAAPYLNQAQEALAQALIDSGMSESQASAAAKTVTGLTAAGMGATLGGATGAATAGGVDFNNRQLHPTEAWLITANAGRFAKQLYGTEQPTAEQIEAALALLVNTAQVMLDNNLGYVVPYSKKADEFLQTLKIDYMQQNGSLNLPGTQGQQQVFYATVEQKNQPWLNAGLADSMLTSVIVKTPLSAAVNNPTGDPSRDKTTGLPLDVNGRYTLSTSVDGKSYSPKYFPCATSDCIAAGKNLDMSDPGTQAYVKALDAQIFKDISKGVNYGTLAVSTGPGAVVLAGTGIAASAGSALTDSAFIDEALKFGSQQGATAFFVGILGHTPAAAARAVALIDLSGGWDAFVARFKKDVFGGQNEKK